MRLDTRLGFRLPQQLGEGPGGRPRPRSQAAHTGDSSGLESAGTRTGSERRHDDADALPGSAPGRDQAPQGRGGSRAAAVRGPEAVGDFWGLGAVCGTWGRTGSATYDMRSPGLPRENEKVGRLCKLGVCANRSRESGGPKGEGPPRLSGWSFPDRPSFTDALL